MTAAGPVLWQLCERLVVDDGLSALLTPAFSRPEHPGEHLTVSSKPTRVDDQVGQETNAPTFTYDFIQDQACDIETNCEQLYFFLSPAMIVSDYVFECN